jgi:hypothetical protein
VVEVWRCGEKKICGTEALLDAKWLSDQQGCVDEPLPSSGTSEVVFGFRLFRSGVLDDKPLFRYSTSWVDIKFPLGERKGTLGPGRPRFYA